MTVNSFYLICTLWRHYFIGFLNVTIANCCKWLKQTFLVYIVVVQVTESDLVFSQASQILEYKVYWYHLKSVIVHMQCVLYCWVLSW